MGPRCSSAETQVCHRSYIIAATVPTLFDKIVKDWLQVRREQDKQVQELLENGIIGRI